MTDTPASGIATPDWAAIDDAEAPLKARHEREVADLDERIEGADLVVTGEGFVDRGSFDGKVVGGVAALGAALDVPVLVVAGEVFDGVGDDLDVVSLVGRFGDERARAETVDLVEQVVGESLAARA